LASIARRPKIYFYLIFFISLPKLNYQKKNIKKKVINKFYNDNNDDGLKNIYSAACSRIREIKKNII